MKLLRFLGLNKNVNRFFSTSRLHKNLANQSIDSNNEKTTHFGFQTVKESDKEKKGKLNCLLFFFFYEIKMKIVIINNTYIFLVHNVFEKVADSYDVMNDAMSLGIHRIWKDIFIQELGPTHGSKLLDTAGGTGDISFRYLNYLKNMKNPKNLNSHVTVSDINNNMLDVGKIRAERLGYTVDNGYDISWSEQDAEKLSFQDDFYTAYTIAFGIRNVTHIDKASFQFFHHFTIKRR